MRFDYVTESWLENASEDELRSTDDEMVEFLDEIDWDINTEEEEQVYNLHNDTVNAIASRFPLNIPHREHGWYL